jgi:hypothetical protein
MDSDYTLACAIFALSLTPKLLENQLTVASLEGSVAPAAPQHSSPELLRREQIGTIAALSSIMM